MGPGWNLTALAAETAAVRGLGGCTVIVRQHDTSNPTFHYRFTVPGIELELHSNWMATTAIEELIGTGALTGRSTLYSCLDRVIWPSDERKKPRSERKGAFKDELFYYLSERWAFR